MSHGCSNCGAYQFNNRSFKMPGACYCKSGITPLPAFNVLPHLHENLMWLARQSAHVISSSRPRVSNFFSGLRVLAMKKGFIDGSRETKIALTEAMQKRFGQDLFDWLGIRINDNYEQNCWVKRFLLRNPAKDQRRNTLPYILLTGSMFHSMKEFEHEALILMEKEAVYFTNQDESIRLGADEVKVRQHRRIFLDFFDKNPDANLMLVLAEIKTSYNFLINKDPDWPALKRIKRETARVKSRKIHRLSRSQLDIEKAAELEKFFDDKYGKSGKPIRVTKLMAIRSVRLRYHYKNDSELLVNINEVLNRRLESDDDYNKRKIQWAISELMQNNTTFSMASVTKKTGISSDQLQSYETYIHNQIKAFGIIKVEVNNKNITARQLLLF